jgi:hypothetical protein
MIGDGTAMGNGVERNLDGYHSNMAMGLAILGVAVVLAGFAAALMGSNSAEVARALAPIVASIIGGSFVLAGAWFAWKSIQLKIDAEERADRRKFELAVTAELITFSTIVVQATSDWNARARQKPDEVPREWPTLNRPRVYEALVDRVGLVEGWAASAVIAFYGNVLDLNELSQEAMNNRPTHGANYATIARRFQAMANNLAYSLDGLNRDRAFPIVDHDLSVLVTPNGTKVAGVRPPPTSLQALLRILGGQSPHLVAAGVSVSREPIAG